MILLVASCGGSETSETTEQQPQQNTTPEASPAFPFPFSAVDIHGNNVTEASLGDKEIFYIHHWGTWCPPCIVEMPAIGQLISDYEDRVGFLMLLDDFDNIEGALNIYESSGITESMQVITVCARTTFDQQGELMQWIRSTRAVPTTVIIDADGNMLELLRGAKFDTYADYLDQHLE